MTNAQIIEKLKSGAEFIIGDSDVYMFWYHDNGGCKTLYRKLRDLPGTAINWMPLSHANIATSGEQLMLTVEIIVPYIMIGYIDYSRIKFID